VPSRACAVARLYAARSNRRITIACRPGVTRYTGGKISARCVVCWWILLCTARPLPSIRHHRSNDDCLEGERENYQVCSVQYCVQQLCTVQCTHIWTDLAVLWIGFCLTGPILLCLDSFVYCVSLYCMQCMRRFVTRWGGPGGIEACP